MIKLVGEEDFEIPSYILNGKVMSKMGWVSILFQTLIAIVYHDYC